MEDIQYVASYLTVLIMGYCIGLLYIWNHCENDYSVFKHCHL